MSEDNVVDFPTTANEPEPPVVDTSPEGLRKLVEEGTPQVLQLVNQNRKEGAEQLRKKVDDMETDLQMLRRQTRSSGAAMLALTDDGGSVVFSLDNTLINIQKGLQAVSTYADAQNSLMDMLINDMIGMVQNMNAAQQAIMVSNGQCQTLIQLLMDKGDITDDEMKATWDALLANKKEQMKRAQQPAPAPEPSPLVG